MQDAMNLHTQTPPKKQPKSFSFRPQFVDLRQCFDTSDSILLRLGLSPAARKEHRADRIEIVCPDDLPRPVEIIDKLFLTVTGSYKEDWNGRPANHPRN
jgi:hypothetical protein